MRQDIIKLSVTEEQKDFVASNLFSIAQAKIYPECVCFAVDNDEELVGFTMYCMDALGVRIVDFILLFRYKLSFK